MSEEEKDFSICCAVKGCRSKVGDDGGALKFFAFPSKNPDQSDLWKTKACFDSSSVPAEVTPRICAKHFVNKPSPKPADVDFVPSRHLPSDVMTLESEVNLKMEVEDEPLGEDAYPDVALDLDPEGPEGGFKFEESEADDLWQDTDIGQRSDFLAVDEGPSPAKVAKFVIPPKGSS